MLAREDYYQKTSYVQNIFRKR